MSDEIESRPVWDAQFAGKILGKLLLVGLTYFDADGSFIEQQQFFGRVESAHPSKGILLALEGRRRGEQYNLPPDTRSINQAEPGEYRLRSTGELITNPDFTVMFSIRRQPNENHF